MSPVSRTCGRHQEPPAQFLTYYQFQDIILSEDQVLRFCVPPYLSQPSDAEGPVTKGKKECLNVETFVEEIKKDPEILFEVVKRLNEIANTTADPEEENRIRSAIEKLCGPASDIRISQSF